MWLEERGGSQDCELPSLKYTGYAYFTFVRDPVERFLSSIFESARRGVLTNTLKRALGPSAVAALAGEDLSHAVIRTTVLVHHAGCRGPLDCDEATPWPVDRHFLLQTSFMSRAPGPGKRYTTDPFNLQYLGHLERIMSELPALAHHFFGPITANGVRSALKKGNAHSRDRYSDSYSGGQELSRFNLNASQLSHNVRAAVASSYLFDSVCLGLQQRGKPAAPTALDFIHSMLRSV